jgi:hypothetical protein
MTATFGAAPIYDQGITENNHPPSDGACGSKGWLRGLSCIAQDT